LKQSSDCPLHLIPVFVSWNAIGLGDFQCCCILIIYDIESNRKYTSRQHLEIQANRQAGQRETISSYKDTLTRDVIYLTHDDVKIQP
jgi:hypothetical protein